MKMSTSSLCDPNLEKWIYRDGCPSWQGGQRSTKEKGLSQGDLADILEKFHIGSTLQRVVPIAASVLPPSLQTQYPSQWLTSTTPTASPVSKRFKSEKSVISREELSKWLVPEEHVDRVNHRDRDFDKWLMQSTPSASDRSSLPGIRVELKVPPLSAFVPPASAKMEINEKETRVDIQNWLNDQSMVLEEDDDDDNFIEILDDPNPLSQWLLVNNGPDFQMDLVSTNKSIEDWLSEASLEREPSIVVISEPDSNADYF